MDESYFELISAIFVELNYFFFNWISRIFLSWIIFWTESWANQYWIEYWITHFLAKFKHWIESDGVSNKAKQSSKVTVFFREFWVKNFETFWNFQILFWRPKNHQFVQTLSSLNTLLRIGLWVLCWTQTGHMLDTAHRSWPAHGTLSAQL